MTTWIGRKGGLPHLKQILKKTRSVGLCLVRCAVTSDLPNVKFRDEKTSDSFSRFSLQRVDPLVQGRVKVLEDFRLHIINSHL